MDKFSIDSRNKIKRIPKRGHYDKATVYEILDQGFLGHASFVIDGQPFIIPTSYGRKGDTLYIHGSSASRMIRHLKEGFPMAFCVTHIDALVLARSIFHHSMNYRSAIIYGKARLVEGDEKWEALKIVSDSILQGRWDESREPNPIEMKATGVLALTIEQASAKIRTGPPGDDKPDYELPIWAGVLPIHTTYGNPIPDPLLKEGIPVSNTVKEASGNKV